MGGGGDSERRGQVRGQRLQEPGVGRQETGREERGGKTGSKRRQGGASADVGGGEAEMVGKNEPGLKEGREKMKNQGGKRQKTGGRLQRETARELWLGRGKLADRQTDGTGGCGVRETEAPGGMCYLMTVPYFLGWEPERCQGPRKRSGFEAPWSLKEEGLQFCFLLWRELGVGGFAIVISCHRKWGWWVQRQHPAPSLSQVTGKPPHPSYLPPSSPLTFPTLLACKPCPPRTQLPTPSSLT